MTAWQDEPPLTRRQIRMRERGGRVDTTGEPAQKPDEAVAPHAGWDADARRSAGGHHSDPAAARTDSALKTSTRVTENARPADKVSASQLAAVAEHLPTRRELRAMRAHSGVQANLQPEIRSAAPQAETAPAESISPDFAEIIASPSIDTTAITVIPAPAAESVTVNHPIRQASDRPLVDLSTVEPPELEPPELEPPELEAPAPKPPELVLPVLDSPTLNPPALHPAESDRPAGFTPPFGHWSTQAKIDDKNQVLDHSVRRDLSVSSGPITTSALVLPSIPSAGDVTRAISNTGEILITGSIDLPLSLGSTGSYPTHFDRSDVDAIIAADDFEDSAAGSAPVRAVRAVSTNNATPALVAGTKARDSRLPKVLAIVAAATMVCVIGLVIAGFVFHVF